MSVPPDPYTRTVAANIPARLLRAFMRRPLALTRALPALILLALGLAATDSTGDVLFGPGELGFAVADATHRANYVTAADVDGDGVLDLVATSSGEEFASPADPGEVAVLLGFGDGSFRPARSYDVGVGPLHVAVGDVDNDQIPDLIVANYGENDDEGVLAVLLGLGGGEFEPAMFLWTGGRARSVAAGDLDADGTDDVVVANQDAVLVYLSNGDGTFGAPSRPSAGPYPDSVVLGDLSGDGILDLAATGRTQVAVLEGTGDGTFQPPQFNSIGGDPSHLVAGDLNGDTHPDLALTTWTQVVVLFGTGGGDFTPPSSWTVGDAMVGAAIGDLNGDGISDLIGAGFNNLDTVVLLGNGTGALSDPIRIALDIQPASVTTHRLNEDKSWDLVFAARSNAVIVLGDRVDLVARAPNYVVGERPVDLVIADLDGDRLLDLVVANQVSNDLAVLRGVGDGTFETPRFHETGTAPQAPAVEDLDGDGVADVVLANEDANSVAVLIGTGAGNLAPPTFYAVGDEPEALAVGDLNGDQVPDLVVGNENSADLSVLLGLGEPNIPNPFNPTTRMGYDIAAGSAVKLALYDARGSLIRVLVDARHEPGSYSIDWDGRDAQGAAVASGVYFYRLSAPGYERARKMVLLR